MKNTKEPGLVIPSDNKVYVRRSTLANNAIVRMLIMVINAIARVHQIPIFVTGFPTSELADFMRNMGDRTGSGFLRQSLSFSRMNKSIALTAMVVALLAIPATAQNQYTLSGTVKDHKTGETIIGAVIRAEGLPEVGAVTNEYGFFSLTVPAGARTILTSSLSYKVDAQAINLTARRTMNIELTSAGNALTEVVVNSKAKNDHVTSAQMGMEKLTMKEISAIPMLFGEKDLIKVIQLLPGVKSAGEGNSGFYVRGGAADQNLVLLDNAVVYNPSHLLGFFSTFNSDAIKDVTLYKGGMPAQFGGRLASVLDVKMNDGNDKGYHVSGGLGLISSRLNVEGPINEGKGSFLVTARRTYADLYLKFSPDSAYNNNKLYFYDLNAKASYKLSDKDRIYVSGYYGKDVLGVNGLFGLDWKNATGTIRWNHLISDKIFSNTSLIFSDYNYNIKVTLDALTANIHSEIKDWNVKQEFEFYSNSANTIRIGLNAIHHSITPGSFTLDGQEDAVPKSQSLENAVYVSNSWKASPKWNVDYGIRLSAFSVLGGSVLYQLDGNHNIIDTLANRKGEIVRTYINPEPRISASYLLNEVSSVKGGYARNSQYMHLISNSGTGNPTDKWVGANNIIKPGVSDQVSVGYFRNFKDNQFEFSAETYYKWMQNQIDYKDGANVLSNDPIEPQLLSGDGRAYGLELLLRKKTGKLTGWIGYTLSRTERRIDGINNGEWYAARQDKTHDLSIVGIYQASPKWVLSATWIYSTGNAVSLPTGKYTIDDKVQFSYTERNGYRMPANHRLDLGATRQLKMKGRYSSEVAFSVYNAYGRENAYIISFKEDPNDKSKTIAEQTSLFRFIPSVSYNFKF